MPPAFLENVLVLMSLYAPLYSIILIDGHIRGSFVVGMILGNGGPINNFLFTFIVLLTLIIRTIYVFLVSIN